LAGNAATVLHADVSFKEPIGGIQIVRLGPHGPTINAYSLKDMVSEKFRAFLQQEDRNKRRGAGYQTSPHALSQVEAGRSPRSFVDAVGLI